MKNFKYYNIDFYLRGETITFNKDGSKFCKLKLFVPSNQTKDIYALFLFKNNQYILFLEHIEFEIKDKITANKYFNFSELYYDPNNILKEKFGKKYNSSFKEIFLSSPYYYENNDEEYELKENIIKKGKLVLISNDIIKVYEKYLSLNLTMEIFK